VAAGFQSLQKNGGRRCAGRHYRLPQGCSTPAPNAHPPTKNTIINATRDSRLGVQHQSSLHANLASEIYFRENIFTFCNTSGAGPENVKRAHPQCRSSTSWRTGQSCLPNAKGGWHRPHPPPSPGVKRVHQESKPLHKSFYSCCGFSLADGHTTSNAPDLFRPPKLSGVGPGQY
jgi:hypothetical protein